MPKKLQRQLKCEVCVYDPAKAFHAIQEKYRRDIYGQMVYIGSDTPYEKILNLLELKIGAIQDLLGIVNATVLNEPLSNVKHLPYVSAFYGAQQQVEDLMEIVGILEHDEMHSRTACQNCNSEQANDKNITVSIA